MAKGWHADQNPALAKRSDLRHYGEHSANVRQTGYLGGPSHSDVATPKNCRAVRRADGQPRVANIGNNRAPTTYKLTGRPRRG